MKPAPEGKSLDSQFLALSFAFLFLGGAGIYLFTGVPIPLGCTSDNPANACSSCKCPIPSPEPEAAQATSSLIFTFGVLFIPIGLFKGGPPSFRRVPGQTITLPDGRVYKPIAIGNGPLFGLGLLVAVVSADAILAPAYLVLKSPLFAAIGAALTVAGLAAMYYGWKQPKSAQS